MDHKQIGKAIHETLNGFYTNRGKALGQQGFRYVNQSPDEKERGLAYIGLRYDEEEGGGGGGRFFSQIVEGQLGIEDAEIDGRLIATWDMTESQARITAICEAHPRARRPLLALRAAYVEEQRAGRSQGSKWWNVMLFEADEGALRRMGRAGTQPAGFLAQIQRWYTDTLHQYSPFEPAPADRADRVTLMPAGSAEHTLLTRNTHLGAGRFALVDRPPVAGPGVGGPDRKVFMATLQTESENFLTRIPISLEARQALQKYWSDRITACPAGGTAALISEMDDFRYRLLVAAANNSDRLQADISRRPPVVAPAVGATNIPDWMRLFTPYESQNFPVITSLQDLQSLFNVNINGGDTPQFAPWRRIFQLWQGDPFAGIGKQIEEMRKELADLRHLPQFALAGVSGPGGAVSVQQLEKFMAQRIANRMVELSLYTLRRNGPNVLETLQNRLVTQTEREMLGEYISTLRTSLIAPDALKRMAEFNKRANEVEALGPGGKLKVVVTGGEVRLGLNTGTGVVPRFVDTAQRAGLPLAFLTAMPAMSVEEFLKRPAADVVLEWKNLAIAQKQQSVRTETGAAFDAVRDGELVKWIFPPQAAGDGRTPIVNFLTATNARLRGAYTVWSGKTAAERAAQPDPLTLP